MKHKLKTPESSGPHVPAYIVTFSDMVTLLLTFFVMLLSLASEQDPELTRKGRDSFIESIRTLGLGVLSGKMVRPHFGEVKLKYFISEPAKFFKGRTIDAKEEDIRRIFQQISRSARTMPSQLVAQKTNFSVTDIRFAPGDATLNKGAKRYLTKFCSDLQQGKGTADISVYVLGLASERGSEKDKWVLSAKRAKAVADFLRDVQLSVLRGWQENMGGHIQSRAGVFGEGQMWPIYWWGAGPGGEWVSRDSPVSEKSQILIAILRTRE